MPEISENLSFTIKDHSVTVQYPVELDAILRRSFRGASAEGTGNAPRLKVIGDGAGYYNVSHNNVTLWEGLSADNIVGILCREIENLLAATSVDTAIQCSAVKAEGRAVLILGPAGSGKSTLAAWLMQQGYGYLADNFVSLATGYSNRFDIRNAVSCLPLPVSRHFGSSELLPVDDGSLFLSWEGSFFVDPPYAERGDDLVERCALIIIPQYYEGAAFDLSPVAPEELRFLVGQALHPAQRLTHFNKERIASFAKAVPAIAVRFGEYDQLAGNVDRFIEALISHGIDMQQFADFCMHWTEPQALAAAKPERQYRTREQILARKKPKLTIGMATYDDFDGTYFTLQALRMYHPETMDDVEYIVVDNNPTGVCAEPLSYLEHKIPNYRYIPITQINGTAVRDFVMEEAAADYVLNLDCHVLLWPGSVARLIRYFEENPDTNDLLHGPIVWDELDIVSSHMSPVWQKGFFGVWAQDERGNDLDGEPFDIPMHGMGLYACRRAAWPGYNRKFRGFGGEEGYVHDKFRQRGGRVLCLPFLRWLHRFVRPLGVPYKISWEDRIRNYVIGATELGLPIDDTMAHFREFLGGQADKIYEVIKAELETSRKTEGSGLINAAE